VEVKGKRKITKEMAEDQEMVIYFRGLLAVSVIMCDHETRNILTKDLTRDRSIPGALYLRSR
jgi:hypothetical protein